MGQVKGLVFAHYGTNWRQQRRLFQSYMRKKSIPGFHAMIERESRAFVGRLHAKPDNFSADYRL